MLDADDDAVLRVPGMKVAGPASSWRLSRNCAARPAQKGRGRCARGRIVRNLTRADPAPGRDVRLTIEARLQQKVLARLSKERQGAVVVLDVGPVSRSRHERIDGALPLLCEACEHLLLQPRLDREPHVAAGAGSDG